MADEAQTPIDIHNKILEQQSAMRAAVLPLHASLS